MAIGQVTILGTGMMGKQLVCHLLNCQLSVQWVKVSPSQDWGREVKDLWTFINRRLFRPEWGKNLAILPMESWQEETCQSDLVIECVIEDLATKQALYSRVWPVLSANSLLTTNTSNLRIADLSADFAPEQKERFLGLHFFAPVRHMDLVELIPSQTFLAEHLEKIQYFVQRQLGKTAILAKDVLGFVANRIGFFANHDAMVRGELAGYGIEEVDYLFGTLIGRTKMGPYALSDYTNLKLSLDAYELYQKSEFDRAFFRPRPLANQLVAKGWLGQSTGQGYYKDKLVLNPETFSYQPAKVPHFQLDRGNLTDTLRAIFQDDNPHAYFLREALAAVFYYASLNVGLATDDYRQIDQALVAGYNWELGPFQLWDRIGVDLVKSQLKERYGDLPAWLEDLSAFYPEEQETISLLGLDQLSGTVLADVPGHSQLWASQDGVLVFSWHTKNASLNPTVLEHLLSAIQVLEADDAYLGLVLTSPGKNFSVGYDVKLMLSQLEAGTLYQDTVDNYLLTHRLIKAMRQARKPILAAVKGRALGGGAELVFLASDVVASVNSRIGLVEYGLGLVPGGGGLAYLTEKILTKPYRRDQKKEDLLGAFLTYSGQKVSNNAYQAMSWRLLPETTTLVRREVDLLPVALDKVRLLAKSCHIPKHSPVFQALGEDFMAIMVGMIKNYRQAGFIQEEEVAVLHKAAEVMAGGRVPMGTDLTFEDILELEKAAFLDLLQSPYAQSKMRALMRKGEK